ncbi:MAG TPA: tRNA 2-thiouridine(34) synthase MnmA [Solirubrobacteraceae bacterium]|jgi:tRNA-specific 2-thiouridylase|nr:tRNA 2-thiouridine(34) synthase MnmA [Solirubrobacteraceae bacterium]
MGQRHVAPRLGRGFSEHLQRPLGQGHLPVGGCTGAAGGAACGDVVRVSLAVDPHSPRGVIADAGFDATGCGAMTAAGSAAVALLQGAPLLSASRIDADAIATELGGLSPGKRHAAELAADALHRALGGAAREHARLQSDDDRVLVAMSGGVDSAVAALLLAREGRGAVAVTLELWSDPANDGESSCCSAQAVRGARALAHGLGMPHLSIDLREEFRTGVVDPWLQGHRGGLTPNPCVRCNGSVRLDAMLALGERLGARALATGHYARLHSGPLLRVAAEERRDQSYVLAALAPESLARMRFPLGQMSKREVRALAAEAGLAVASRRDSQDLCFLAGTRQDAFLARHGSLVERPGPVVDARGRRLGEHRGAHLYTVGQRRGLGIGGGAPLYVLGTDAHANTVTAGDREQLLTRRLPVRDVVLHRGAGCVNGVRLRAHGRTHSCRVDSDLKAGSYARADVELARPVERTAPGQLACLYADELVVGYGTVVA